MVFGGWDIYTDSAYQAASKAGVLEAKDLDKAKKFLSGIKPMKAAFDQNYVKNLSGTNVKKGRTKYDLADADSRGHPQIQKEEQARPRW